MVIFLINPCYNYCKLCTLIKIHVSEMKYQKCHQEKLASLSTLQNSSFDFFKYYATIIYKSFEHIFSFHFGHHFFYQSVYSQGEVSGADWCNFDCGFYCPMDESQSGLTLCPLLMEMPWSYGRCHETSRQKAYSSIPLAWYAQVFVFHSLTRSMQEFFLVNISKIADIILHWQLLVFLQFSFVFNWLLIKQGFHTKLR